MSEQDQQAPIAPATAAADQHPTAPAPVHKPANSSEAPSTVSMTSEQLKQRLEQERARGEAAILKKYGVESQDALKALLETGRKASDERKTELERMAGQLEEAKKGSARAAELEALVTELTAVELGRLPEKVRETILAKHPDNPQQQIALIKVMREAGLLDGASSSPAPVVQPPAPEPANAGATKPAPSPSPAPSKFDEYQQLLTKDPFGAAIFFDANRLAIEASRPSQ